MKLHDCFIEFNNNITLSVSKKDSIITSRNAIRETIKKYFNDILKVKQPKFRIQGSFAINTALQPINDNEVDIDDGLYLQNIDTNNKTTWPTPKGIHNTIVDALENQTKDGCEDKTNCVRVIYQNDYHVDIPIYIMDNEHALLANKKTNKWEPSDSKDFKDWYFANRNNDQTTRIIRYLKAWRDYNQINIASIELTILGTQNHIPNDDDANSLQQTVSRIYSYLFNYRVIKKPVSPYENLWENKTDIESVLKKWEQLRNDLNTAINNNSIYRATVILQEQFGERFPIIKEKITDSSTRVYDSGPKPWKQF